MLQKMAYIYDFVLEIETKIYKKVEKRENVKKGIFSNFSFHYYFQTVKAKTEEKMIYIYKKSSLTALYIYKTFSFFIYIYI